MIDKIERELKQISPWPWSAYFRVSPRGAHKHWHIGNKDGACQITMIGKERDYLFIAKSPERIAALVEYVRAAEAWFDAADVSQKRDPYRQLVAAREKLGLTP